MHRRQWIKAGAGSVLAWTAAPGAPALARPSPEQVAWQDMELEMFLHFGPATWQDTEYDKQSTPPGRIHPAKLDTEQWAEAARALGAGQLIFVAKHTGGFCWWQTQTTTYGVAQTPWQGRKGDVMRELAESCRRRNIRLGIYLSPQDTFFGAGVGGRCATAEAQERYSAAYRQQWTEVLSRYGDISEVWFDGSSVIDVGDILKRHAPHAMVFQSRYATIRWVGNESGVAPYPAWNAVPARAARDGVATAKDGWPDGEVWMPIECDARMRNTWFWNTRNAESLKSVEQLLSMYYRSVGHGAVLLLNHTPDTSGLIPEADVRRGSEFGSEVRRRFAGPLGETRGEGDQVELRLARPAFIDHVIAMEEIREGERVREYIVEAMSGGAWQRVAAGSAIGHKKIDVLKPVVAERVRLHITRSAARPLIRSLAVYHCGDSPAGNGPASGAFDFRVVKTWTPASFSGQRTTWAIDLTPFVRDAGQYELEFIETGGGLRVHSLVLIHGGVPAPEFVSRQGGSNRFRIGITGLGVKLALRAEVSGATGNDSGQAFLRLLP